ncbi:hypothetical protein SAMN05216224_102572 [Thioclava dalianensis]|nr:hypothetical protein SAMN05216224_102572 [Thioclava dalianensis]
MIIALLFGAGVYYAQEYAYYQNVSADAADADLTLAQIDSSVLEPIAVQGYEGIDADSSPLRYRACFHTDLSIATATETYQVYADPKPLNGPNWFKCYDAKKIGADLERGDAVAFLSHHDIHPGVDRVVAIYPDGRAFVWHQLNDEAEK